MFVRRLLVRIPAMTHHGSRNSSVIQYLWTDVARCVHSLAEEYRIGWFSCSVRIEIGIVCFDACLAFMLWLWQLASGWEVNNWYSFIWYYNWYHNWWRLWKTESVMETKYQHRHIQLTRLDWSGRFSRELFMINSNVKACKWKWLTS